MFVVQLYCYCSTAVVHEYSSDETVTFCLSPADVTTSWIKLNQSSVPPKPALRVQSEVSLMCHHPTECWDTSPDLWLFIWIQTSRTCCFLICLSSISSLHPSVSLLYLFFISSSSCCQYSYKHHVGMKTGMAARQQLQQQHAGSFDVSSKQSHAVEQMDEMCCNIARANIN